MAIWAIGDVQGCLASLEALLPRLRLSPGRDRLWFVGDLVNRGPASLGVLRRVRALGPAATVVLGNHDLHLLSAAAGLREPGKVDTFHDVLAASDREALLAWLAGKPLAHAEVVGDQPWLMVHAGLHPRWDGEAALARAAEAKSALGAGTLLAALTLRPAPPWRDELRGAARLAAIAGVLTRLRVCTSDGAAAGEFTGPPEDVPEGHFAWWAVPGRAQGPHRVVCGHWASQGLRIEPAMVAVDSGCVWGNALTAFRLDDGEVVSVPCQDQVSARRD